MLMGRLARPLAKGHDSLAGSRALAMQSRSRGSLRSGRKLSRTVNRRHDLIGRKVMDHVARSRNPDELASG